MTISLRRATTGAAGHANLISGSRRSILRSLLRGLRESRLLLKSNHSSMKMETYLNKKRKEAKWRRKRRNLEQPRGTLQPNPSKKRSRRSVAASLSRSTFSSKLSRREWHESKLSRESRSCKTWRTRRRSNCVRTSTKGIPCSRN